MKRIRVYSENNDFQHAETLKNNRTKRHRSREFLVEGVRNITQAVDHAWPIRAFLSCDERPLSTWARTMLEKGGAKQHFLLPTRLMDKLSDKEQTSELLAIASMMPDDLSRIDAGPEGRVVVLDRPGNPGNLGTILRSCDAFQVDGVIVTGHAVDLYDPQVVRATVGSFFARPVVRLPSQGELLPWIERLRSEPGGLRIVGTSASGTMDLGAHRFEGRCLIVFGNETTGMSAGYREICDDIVTIPMGGTASSLNLSSAVSIVLYEAYRRATERELRP
jgi:TrmH family RNA methyltransferase